MRNMSAVHGKCTPWSAPGRDPDPAPPSPSQGPSTSWRKDNHATVGGARFPGFLRYAARGRPLREARPLSLRASAETPRARAAIHVSCSEHPDRKDAQPRLLVLNVAVELRAAERARVRGEGGRVKRPRVT
eukprot:6833131-Prymnesium_polylepis.1